MSAPVDLYAGMSSTLDSPCNGAFAITPGSPLPFVTKKILFGGGGSVVLTGLDGNTVTFNVGALTLLDIRAVAIGNATTATNITGFY